MPTFDQDLSQEDLNDVAEESKKNIGGKPLDIPGKFLMRATKFSNKDGDLLSPVLKEWPNGFLSLSVRLEIVDEAKGYKGRSIFANIGLRPNKIPVPPGATPQEAQNKKEEYKTKLTNILRMNMPKIWALTGNNRLSVSNFDELLDAIGARNPDVHAMNEFVIAEVGLDKNSTTGKMSVLDIMPAVEGFLSQPDLKAAEQLQNLNFNQFGGSGQQGDGQPTDKTEEKPAGQPAEETKPKEDAPASDAPPFDTGSGQGPGVSPGAAGQGAGKGTAGSSGRRWKE